MKSNSARLRRNVITSTVAAAAICMFPVTTAFAVNAPASASASSEAFSVPSSADDGFAVLAATPWVTSGAVDQNGDPVALDDARAANFVGNAYFKTDGTFTMYNLDDTPKMQGDWEMREVDGELYRWIAAKNSAGEVMFERLLPIVTLNANEFTYRVVDAADSTQWVDIVHSPTDHVEPGSGEGDNEGGEGNNEGGEGEENPDNGGSDTNDESGTGDTENTGGSVTDSDANTGQGAKDAQQLATTGGNGLIAGIVASAVALLSGATLLVGRAVRRRLG